MGLRVAVVGGGVVGLFTSYNLLARGAGVVVVDAQPPGGRASQYNAGLITPSLAAAPRISLGFVLRALLGLGGAVRASPAEILSNPGWFARALRSYGRGDEVVRGLSRASLDMLRSFISSSGVDVDLVEGVVAAFASRERAEEAARASGGELLGAEDLEELGYRGFGGGVLIRDEVSINPAKLYRALVDLVRGMGGEFVSRRAERVWEEGGRVYVGAGSERLGADAAVISAGSWSRELCRPLGYDPMVIPARGLVKLYRSRGRVVKAPALFEDHGVGVAQHGETILRVTGFFDLAGFSTRWSRGRRAWLERVAKRHVTGFHGLEEIEEGMGFRPCSADMLPVVGKIPTARNIYIATGHCRLGVTMAAATGSIVSSMILGEKPPVESWILEKISPDRFSPEPAEKSRA